MPSSELVLLPFQACVELAAVGEGTVAGFSSVSSALSALALQASQGFY